MAGNIIAPAASKRLMKTTISLMHSGFCVLIVTALIGCDSPKGIATTRPTPKNNVATLTAHNTSTGTFFRVSDDGRVLTATDENGQVLWTWT
jgi:hypothetical protein